jgi:hypothetical protein
MKKQLLYLRIFFMIMTLGGVITAGVLSGITSYGRAEMGYTGPVKTYTSIPVDGAYDGGAAGFAIMSGLSLVALSITFLRKEE